jgi:hypothetical protein
MVKENFIIGSKYSKIPSNNNSNPIKTKKENGKKKK